MPVLCKRSTADVPRVEPPVPPMPPISMATRDDEQEAETA